MKKWGIIVVGIVAALMSFAAPAYAVTENRCERLDGSVEGPEDNPVCIFPADLEECDEAGGLPTRDEDECIVLIDD